MKLLSVRARKPVALKTSKAEAAEVLFIKYEKLALSAASAVSRRTGVPYSELEDEARSLLGGLVFEEWDRFDAEKACASTWIYTKVYRYLQNYVSRGRPVWRAKGKRVDVDKVEVEVKSSKVDSILSEVGDEGWALLKIIIEAPGELANSLTPTAPARTVTTIRRYLSDGHWKTETIDRAFSQVEHCLGRKRGSPIYSAT